MENSSETWDDQRLLAGLKSDSQKAYEALVRQYHGPMKHVAATMVDEGLAEECVQEALLAAIKNLSGFEGRSSLKTWLFSIVGNQARLKLRKGKREVFLEDLSEGSSFSDALFKSNGHWAQAPSRWHDNSPEALLSYEEFRHCLDKTIDNLPELQKAVIMLREYQGVGVEEVCNILDISASNIRVLMHRARSNVYSMIDHYEETGTC